MGPSLRAHAHTHARTHAGRQARSWHLVSPYQRAPAPPHTPHTHTHTPPPSMCAPSLPPCLPLSRKQLAQLVGECNVLRPGVHDLARQLSLLPPAFRAHIGVCVSVCASGRGKGALVDGRVGGWVGAPPDAVGGQEERASSGGGEAGGGGAHLSSLCDRWCWLSVAACWLRLASALAAARSSVISWGTAGAGRRNSPPAAAAACTAALASRSMNAGVSTSCPRCTDSSSILLSVQGGRAGAQAGARAAELPRVIPPCRCTQCRAAFTRHGGCAVRAQAPSTAQAAREWVQGEECQCSLSRWPCAPPSALHLVPPRSQPLPLHSAQALGR